MLNTPGWQTLPKKSLHESLPPCWCRLWPPKRRARGLSHSRTLHFRKICREKPVTRLGRDVTITSYAEMSPPPKTFDSFRDHDLKLVCFTHVTFLLDGDNSVKIHTCNTHLSEDLNRPPRGTSTACTHSFVTRQRGRFTCASQLMRLPREVPGIWDSGLTLS